MRSSRSSRSGDLNSGSKFVRSARIVFFIWLCIFSWRENNSSSERFWRHFISITVNTISRFEGWKSTNKSSARSPESESKSANRFWCRSIGTMKESSRRPFPFNIRFIRVVPSTSNTLLRLLSSCIIILLLTERMSESNSRNDVLSLTSIPKFLKCGAIIPSISDVGRHVKNDEMPFSSALGM